MLPLWRAQAEELHVLAEALALEQIGQPAEEMSGHIRRPIGNAPM